MAATTFYVSRCGEDCAPGDFERPWRSLGRVNQQMFAPGDRILLRGGEVHDGQLVFSNLDADNCPIEITSYGDDKAILSAGCIDGIVLHNVRGFYLHDLILRGSGDLCNRGSGIAMYADTRQRFRPGNVCVKAVEVSGFGKNGISVGIAPGAPGYAGVFLEEIIAFNNGHSGIHVWGDLSTREREYAHERIEMRRVVAAQNLGIAGLLKHSGNGILLSDTHTATIENCLAHHNGARNTAHACGPAGIWACNSRNVRISRCESHHNATASATDGGGFGFDGGVSDSVLEHNLSYDNDGPGYLLSQYYGARAFRGNRIVDNVSRNDSRRNDYGAIHLWCPEEHPIEDITIRQNHVEVSRSLQGRPRALMVEGRTRSVRVERNHFRASGIPVFMEIVPGQKDLLFRGNEIQCDRSAFYWEGLWYSSEREWERSFEKRAPGRKSPLQTSAESS